MFKQRFIWALFPSLRDIKRSHIFHRRIAYAYTHTLAYPHIYFFPLAMHIQKKCFHESYSNICVEYSISVNREFFFQSVARSLGICIYLCTLKHHFNPHSLCIHTHTHSSKKKNTNKSLWFQIIQSHNSTIATQKKRKYWSLLFQFKKKRFVCVHAIYSFVLYNLQRRIAAPLIVFGLSMYLQ